MKAGFAMMLQANSSNEQNEEQAVPKKTNLS